MKKNQCDRKIMQDTIAISKIIDVKPIGKKISLALLPFTKCFAHFTLMNTLGHYLQDRRLL